MLVLVLVLGGAYYFIGEKFADERHLGRHPNGGRLAAIHPQLLETELKQGHAASSIYRGLVSSPANSTKPMFSKLAPFAMRSNAAALPRSRLIGPTPIPRSQKF
jgi:hypothetical protein